MNGAMILKHAGEYLRKTYPHNYGYTFGYGGVRQAVKILQACWFLVEVVQ